MAVYRGYCDESEELSSDVIIVAGLVAPTNRWESFEANWRIALAYHKVAYFHGLEFYNRKGPWAFGTEWDNENKRGLFIRDLIAVVQARETKPNIAVISIVSKSDYRRRFASSSACARFNVAAL